jgi:hypothetical protein
MQWAKSRRIKEKILVLFLAYWRRNSEAISMPSNRYLLSLLSRVCWLYSLQLPHRTISTSYNVLHILLLVYKPNMESFLLQNTELLALA